MSSVRIMYKIAALPLIAKAVPAIASVAARATPLLSRAGKGLLNVGKGLRGRDIAMFGVADAAGSMLSRAPKTASAAAAATTAAKEAVPFMAGHVGPWFSRLGTYLLNIGRGVKGRSLAKAELSKATSESAKKAIQAEIEQYNKRIGTNLKALVKNPLVWGGATVAGAGAIGAYGLGRKSGRQAAMEQPFYRRLFGQ